jgi:hypothetical protein
MTPARHSSNIVLNMGIKVDWMTAFALASDPARFVIAPLLQCLVLLDRAAARRQVCSPNVEAPFDNSAFPIYIEETKP